MITIIIIIIIIINIIISPDIPVHLLRSVATYKGVESSAPLVTWFWEVMEEFSLAERSLFLRYELKSGAKEISNYFLNFFILV